MADMDIEMDVDIDVGMVDDMAVQQAEVEILPDQPTLVSSVSAPNDPSGPDAEQPTPEKVHIRGLDNLTSKDIKAFVNDNYDKNQIVRIEWIDDSSANIVYESPEIAREALLAFSTLGLEEISQMPILQTIPAQPYSKHPDMHLKVRLAVVGDRKQAGARERSRFYLLNPEHDPAERRKNGSHRRGGNRYRERDDDGYRSRRYDDQEQRDREGRDQAGGFDASLYDDDEAALAVRAKRNHGRRESASSGSDSRARDYRQARFERRGVGKELFPDRGDQGRLLRDRSASPARFHDSAAERNREKARSIKSHLVGSRSEPKELFPQKLGVTSLRSGVFDAADEAADLFARKMPIPLVDGASDSRPKRDLASRITSRTPAMDGFSIRGTAKASATQNFTIKGTADVRELFPASSNAGKELFSERLEGRGGRRQKAEDLFR